MALTVILEASPLVADGSATVAVRLAGLGSRPYIGYRGFTDWRSGLTSVPRFSTSIGWDDSGWSGSSIPQVAAIDFATFDPVLSATLAGLLWRKARVTVRTGDDVLGEPVWNTVITGTVEDAKSSGGVLSLLLADLSGDLTSFVVPGTFAGTGGLEGPDEATGRTKRRSWGRVFNVEGRILDKANSIYEFGDPAFPLQSFDMLKDKGRSGPMTVVAWQGSAAATLAALQAAAAPTGGGAVAPSIACAKWYTTPAGPLTADLRGELIAGNYQEDAGSIAQGILAARSTVTLTNRPGVTALRNFAAGLHCGDPSETVAMALDRLLLPLSLAWSLSGTGTVNVTEFTWNGPVELLAAQESTREATFLPLNSRKVGFQRNERIQNTSEISAVLLAATDVTYADGTPIEALKPAEAGATLGARAGTNLVDAGGSTLGDTAIKNNAVSIGANGQLTGAGGGQVTIGGLGYLGDLNATYGAAWAASLSGRPSNLSALLGSEAIQNLFVSIGANGALAGAGGGQVTIGGLGYSGALNATFDGVTDTRATNQPPTWYRTNYPQRVAREFKSIYAVGVPAPADGYGILETVVDWLDPSGGRVKQRFTSGDNSSFARIWERVGSSDDSTWTPWLRNFSGYSLPALGGDLVDASGNALQSSGAYGVLNVQVSIAANGTLAGGGGGQVTYSGLGGGALGLLATLDLTSGYAIGALPVAKAAGGLVNANVSIAANGSLAGGGGGQVTIGGLGYGGDLDAQRNTRIYITASLLYGIGGGDGTAVANVGVSIAANGALSGGGGGQVTLPGIFTGSQTVDGIVKSSNNVTTLDMSNGRLVFRVGSYMIVMGNAFGSNNQFTRWEGPNFANLSDCTENNGVLWSKTNGDAYFGGTLSTGTIKNGGQNSTASATAFTFGPFSSAGRTVNTTFVGRAYDVLAYGATYTGDIYEGSPAEPDPFTGSRQTWRGTWRLTNPANGNIIGTASIDATSKSAWRRVGSTGGAEPMGIYRWVHDIELTVNQTSTTNLGSGDGKNLTLTRTQLINLANNAAIDPNTLDAALLSILSVEQ